MDIESIRSTIDVKFTLDRKVPQDLTLTVSYFAVDEVWDYTEPGDKSAKLSAVIREVLIDAVKGWDLTANGQPVPCTEEEKRKYLPVLLGSKIKVDEKKPRALFDDILGRSLIEIAGNPESFLVISEKAQEGEV